LTGVAPGISVGPDGVALTEAESLLAPPLPAAATLY
jgi:hypothetical protein